MMIQPKDLFDALSDRDVGFYAGVPDSLLADFCAYVDEHAGHDKHLIAANEGNAIAMAMGYHMATAKVAVVYMQNSGLGNAINPLVSLADPNVYKVPMLMLIGWRGEPGIKDEPQHIKQGQVTLAQLDVLDIPYWVLDGQNDIEETLNAAFSCMRTRNAPVALVVRKNTFGKYSPDAPRVETAKLVREDALRQLLRLCDPSDLIVSTTGKTSREVFELRTTSHQPHTDFLTVGGMGHTSSIALGVAIGQPKRRVICLDGDGSLLMHMGSMPVIAQFQPRSFVHVLLNNQSHESVGGQGTAADMVDFSNLSESVGYTAYAVACDQTGIENAWASLQDKSGPVMLEIKIRRGSRGDLGRPTTTAEENKLAFMGAAGV